MPSSAADSEQNPPATAVGRVRKARWKLLLIPIAALSITVAAIEIPALIGTVDYRFSVGVAERRGDPKPYPTRSSMHVEKAPGDLVAYYHLLGGETREVDFRTDRFGLRNEAELERAPVAVVGDSFVLNATVPTAHLFTTLLAARLRVPVANISHSGWGPNNELAALRRIGLRLQPRVVLWVFYEGNDVTDTLAYGGPDIAWTGRLFVTSAYVRLAGLAELIVHGQSRRNFSWGEGAPFGSCVPPCPVPPCSPMYFGNLTGPLSWFEEIAVGRALDLLSAAAAEAHDRGAAFVLVYAPVTLRVYRDVCRFDEDNPARRSRLNTLPDRMQRWAQTHGAGFIDVTPALTAAAARGEVVYYPDDTHWTAAGNAVVAEALVSDSAVIDALAAAVH